MLALLGVPACGDGAGGAAADGEALLVSAAASLRDVLAEIARDFESDAPGTRVQLNFGASGLLVQQILRGAPVDLLVAASPREIERLERAGRTAGPVFDVASNRLVLAVPRGGPAPADLSGLAGARFARIAVGNPATAPVGRYTRQALRAAGLESTLKPRLVLAESARQTLGYLARGEVDAAVLYRTDARLEPRRVVVAFEIDPRTHEPIVYRAVAIEGTTLPDPARRFLDHLLSESARRRFAAHGFAPTGP